MSACQPSSNFSKATRITSPSLSYSLNAAVQVILSIDGRREASEGCVGGRARGKQGADRTSRGRPTAKFKVSDQREPSPSRACRRKGRRCPGRGQVFSRTTSVKSDEVRYPADLAERWQQLSLTSVFDHSSPQAPSSLPSLPDPRTLNTRSIGLVALGMLAGCV
jgi:hypothetical protein